MINVRSKALVLVAVAAACGYASAATITLGSTRVAGVTGNVSKEGATGAASTIEINKFTVAMGAFQTRDSVLQLSLSNGGQFLSGGTTKPSATCTSNDIVFDIGAPTSNSSTWDFGITAVSGATSAAICTFNSVTVLRSSLTSAGAVSISSGVKRVSDTGYTYDAGAAKAILTVESQIVSIGISTAFNGVVDYQSKSGYGFVANDTTVGDQLNLVVKTRDLDLSSTASFSVGFAITAESGKSFSFLDAEACGVTGKTPDIGGSRATALGKGLAVGGGTLTINSTCTTVTYVGGSGAALTGNATSLYYYSVELGTTSATPSTGVVIEPMTFPAFTATVSNGTTASITPGSWTSNGATVVIPYMPINLSVGSTTIDPIVTIANRSALSGTLTGTMIDEDGNSCTLNNLGTVGATRSKNLGGLIKTAFAACSTLSQTSTERMYITITATLPDSTTAFYSGYNVGGSSRVTVVNSSNGK